MTAASVPDEATRAVILDAARQEFTTSGYAATSMESVARRAGVSTKTLYRLIANKGALFEAIVTDGLDRLVSRIRLRPCENEDIECALRDALIACGELILDGAVIGLLRGFAPLFFTSLFAPSLRVGNDRLLVRGR
jgi:AcrR family transcriptional regulator